LPVFHPRSRRSRLDSDPAFDDAELRRAREDAAMGGWEGVRDLLARTGYDWPLRTHRITVLANASVGLQWPGAWSQAEPDRPDALVMGACAQAARLHELIVRRDPSVDDAAAVRAVARCKAAAEAAPDDPNPYGRRTPANRAASPFYPPPPPSRSDRATADDDAIRIDSMKAAAAGDAADTDQLHELGYPQLLHRGLTGFKNMGVSFSVIGVTRCSACWSAPRPSPATTRART
jgi:hypothetical protein